MNKILLIAVILVLGSSCTRKTYLLDNGRTEVPKDNSVFNNRVKFNPTLLTIVDVNALYQEISNPSGYYGIYKFYQNGNVNWFTVQKNQIPSPSFFNPKVNGYRGIYYSEGGLIKMDLFAEITGLGKFGIIRKTLKFEGDSLTIINDKTGYVQKYLKRPFQIAGQDYIPEW